MITLRAADAEALVVRALEKCGASHVSAKSTAAALVAGIVFALIRLVNPQA